MRFTLVSLALVALAPTSPVFGQTLERVSPERPTIIVDGYGETETMPDVAIVGYTLRGEGESSDSAVRSMTALGARLQASLRQLDPTAGPRTSKVEIAAVKSDDCKEREYGPPQLSKGACAILGYVATQSVTVRTASVKSAGTMVGLVGRGSGENASISSFELSDPKPAQRRAVAAAIADAQSKASAVASASHLNLGRILSISTAGQPSNGRDVTVTALREAPPVVSAPPPVVVNLTPEPITTSATLTVTYAIDR